MEGIARTNGSDTEIFGTVARLMSDERVLPANKRGAERRSMISAARFAAACLSVPREAGGVIRAAVSVCREFTERSDFLKAGGDIGEKLFFSLEDLDHSIESFMRTVRSIT